CGATPTAGGSCTTTPSGGPRAREACGAAGSETATGQPMPLACGPASPGEGALGGHVAVHPHRRVAVLRGALGRAPRGESGDEAGPRCVVGRGGRGGGFCDRLDDLHVPV